jgi:hypothetical protein
VSFAALAQAQDPNAVAASTASPQCQILCLCESISKATNPALFATLIDQANGEHYDVHPGTETASPDSDVTLAAVLKRETAFNLSRVQRYAVAAALASAHMQFYSTPWLETPWLAEHIKLPSKANASAPEVDEKPYILAHFERPAPRSALPAQASFSSLAILLLELCFGATLDSHPRWKESTFAPLRYNPDIRRFVAGEWLKEVLGEAGPDFYRAVKWVYHDAPSDTADNKWRNDFAANVVHPLQKCYDSVKP